MNHGMSVRNWFEPINEPWIFFSGHEQLGARDIERNAEGHHTDDRGRAAAAEHGERLLRRRLGADGFERIVDAATGQVLHRLSPRRLHGR